MMQESGEHTPLLRRTGKRPIPPLDNESSFGETNSAFIRPLSQHNTSRYSDDDGKHDRRSFWHRLSICSNLHSYWLQTALRLFPPLDDATSYEDVDYYANDNNNSDNDEYSWQCTAGTREHDGIWMNVSTDQVGTLMAITVWILIAYSAWTVVLLAQHHHMPTTVTAVHCTICALAMASHAKTSWTDPGAVPSSAVPLMPLPHNNNNNNNNNAVEQTQHQQHQYHAMCSHCQTYKPAKAHHCRICQRCISGLDHHCPWMNTCIGTANMKHFILFLVYTWTGAAFGLLLFFVNYFFCVHVHCEFSGLEIHLVRVMSCICVMTLLFTSSMLMNVVYAVMTGIGTIDRLKKKATATWETSTEEATPLKNIFGIGPVWTWLLPMDPLFDDYDTVMGYTTRQRLLRTEPVVPPVSSATQQHQEKSSSSDNIYSSMGV